MTDTIESRIYDFIINNEIATEAEIQLVTNICGWNKGTLNNIIWCRTAYHDAEQCMTCEPDNFIDPEGYFTESEEEEEDEDNNE